MRQRDAQRRDVSMVPAARTRSLAREAGALALGLTLVASLLLGCVIVPVGHGYQHERHGHWHDAYRYDR